MSTHFDQDYAVIADLNGIDIRLPFSTSFPLDDKQATEIGRALVAGIPGAIYMYVEDPTQ